MKRALVERYGSSLEVDGVTYRAFPIQPQMAGATEDDLVDLIGNRRRAAYVASVVDAWADADEDRLRTAPWDEAEAWLREIKGVGEWSAALVLLRGLGRMEQMPLTMKPMLAAMEEFYGPGEPIERVVERYGRWLGYWAFYLRVAEGQFARERGATSHRGARSGRRAAR